MVSQRDNHLLPSITQYGCLLLCYLEIVQNYTTQRFNAWTVNNLYTAFLHNEWITDRCRVVQPDKLLQSLGMQLSGWIRHEPVEYSPRADEIEIQQWHNARTNHTHFVLIDYDPLGDSVTVREGRMTRKTIVRLA